MISYSLSYRQPFIRILFAEKSCYMLPNALEAEFNVRYISFDIDNDKLQLDAFP